MARGLVWRSQTQKLIDVAVALIWPALPDPTDGAIYLIGPGDRARMPWLADHDAIEPLGVPGHPSGSIQGE